MQIPMNPQKENKMIKHIGKHGDRKVAIVFREIPGEEHMCLVVYPDTLPVAMHDALMRDIETPQSQQAENLGDSLFRSLFTDGRPMLQTFHAEGMLKKVQTKQVVVTPNPSSHVNLGEMNNILRKMKLGESAIREMADLDKNRGMSNYKRKDDFGREIGAPTENLRGSNVAGSDAARALDDISLANNLLEQAQKMETEAKGLLAESARLMKEAGAINGSVSKPETIKTSRTRTRKQAVTNATP